MSPVFITLFCTFFLIGLLRPSQKLALTFVVLLFCLPTGNAFNQSISHQGIYFFDGFTIAYLIRTTILLTKSSFSIRCNKWVTISLALYLIYFIAALANGGLDKHTLKDLRPALTSLLLVTGFNFLNRPNISFSHSEISKIAILAGAACIAKLLLLNSGVYLIEDEYYEANAFRYIDGSSYACALYLIYQVGTYSSRPSQSIKLSIIPLIGLLLTNSRFLLVSFGIAIAAKAAKSPAKLVIAICLIALVSAAFVWVSFALDSTRVTDHLSISAIEYQLETRFGPAIEATENSTFADILFGRGMGTTFYIPWFSYRGLDPIHSNIDSAYFTYFAKYGLISLLLLAGFLMAATPRNSTALSTRVMLILMFIVSATPYQPYAAGLLFSAMISGKHA